MRWRKAGVLISVLLLHWPVEGLAQGDKARTFSEAFGCRFERDLGKMQTYMRQNDRKALEAAWQELTMKGLCRDLPGVEAFIMDYRGAGALQIRMPGDRAENGGYPSTCLRFQAASRVSFTDRGHS